MEDRDSFVKVSSTEVETAYTYTRADEVRLVLGCFSDPDPFLATGDPFGELSNLGQGPEQKATGKHGQSDALAEAVTDRFPCEGLHGLP